MVLISELKEADAFEEKVKLGHFRHSHSLVKFFLNTIQDGKTPSCDLEYLEVILREAMIYSSNHPNLVDFTLTSHENRVFLTFNNKYAMSLFRLLAKDIDATCIFGGESSVREATDAVFRQAPKMEAKDVAISKLNEVAMEDSTERTRDFSLRNKR